MQIRSERLVVEIAEPGTVYRRSRFDWTSFITQVTLDGQHTYCIPESFDPNEGTGGDGLCNEFGILTPVGFEGTEPGEKFPKLGIGLLTRPSNEPYKFTYRYEIAPFPMHTDLQEDRATFTVEPVECRGYAARLVKHVTVRDNILTIAYNLENTGSERITTQEYNHNFISLNRNTIGPEYLIRASSPIQCEPAPAILQLDGHEVRWNGVPEKPFYCRTTAELSREPGWWEVLHTPSGVGMREQDSFPWSSFAIWGTDHVVSGEAFIRIDLAPGESLQWQREWTFFSDGK